MSKLAATLKVSVFTLAALVGLALLAVSLPLNGFKALSVQTGSMKPNINPGDLVLVKRVPVSGLEVGDVITYVNPANQKQTITHRIFQIKGSQNGPKSFILKGDANKAVDTPVPQNAVLGKVNYQVPWVGRVLDFIRQPLGLVLVIYIPAMMIIINELRRLTEYYRAQRSYVAEGYKPNHKTSLKEKLATGSKLTALLAVASLSIAIPAKAAFTTSARLTNNTITMALPPPNQCQGSSSTNININNSSNQTATSGDAASNNNTNGGSATSGNASNTNSTSININTNNCH